MPKIISKTMLLVSVEYTFFNICPILLHCFGLQILPPILGRCKFHAMRQHSHTFCHNGVQRYSFFFIYANNSEKNTYFFKEKRIFLSKTHLSVSFLRLTTLISIPSLPSSKYLFPATNNHCWITLNAKRHRLIIGRTCFELLLYSSTRLTIKM